MRFRLRDILLLMLLVAVYLTTGKFVFQIGELEGEYSSTLLVGASTFCPLFVVLFTIHMLVGHWWAVRKVKPIRFRLMVPIPWKSLFLQLSLAVGCGIVAIIVNEPIAAAAFIGASTPFLGVFPSAILLGTAKIGTGGLVYQSRYENWSELEVARNQNGLIETITLARSPWVMEKTSSKSLLSSVLSVAIPEELQQELTEMYEKNTSYLTCLHRSTSLPSKPQNDPV